MQRKYGKWYADWDDANGKRHRKAFDTKKQALRYQTRMRSDVTAKKARASAQSATSPKRGPRRTTAKPRPAKSAAASHAT
jgi:hypothetical protein